MRARDIALALATVLTSGGTLAACGEDPVPAADAATPDASAGQPDGATGQDPGPAADVPAGALPRLTIDDLVYVGAFRLPAADFGPSSMNYSQGPLAWSADAGSVFVVGHSHQQAIAEFAVPALVDSQVVTELTMAEAPLQAFTGVLDRVDNPQGLDRVGGLAVIAGELLVNAYEYYDAPGDNTHTTLVVRDPADLAGSAVAGYFELGGRAHASGWVSPIPAEWQADLGGAWITGSSSGQPIIGRLSVGPSAFVFDPLAIVGGGASDAPGAVATTALLDFSLDHPLADDLSNDAGDNDLWTHLTRAVFGFIPPGTSTYVTVGHTGGTASGVCYKCTPSDGSNCGGYCANDADDYSLAYWLWDVADLIAVRDGAMDPWEPRPYAYGAFEAPFAATELGGGTWDPVSGTLLLTLQAADREQGTYSNPPIVVAYRVE